MEPRTLTWRPCASLEVKAMVRADGSLSSPCGANGSIHKVGSTVQGAPACNGWTFWHYEAEGALKPIDALRQTYLLATQP